MKDFLTRLFRRKWHAVVFLLAMVGVQMTLAYVLPPKYEAKATLVLTPGREKKPFLPNEKDSRTALIQVSMEDVGTEVEILLSRPVLEVAVDKNHFERDDPPPREQRVKYLAWHAIKAFRQFLIDIGLKTYVPPREGAIETLRNKLDIDFVKRTNIITIKLRSSVPELARDVVNTVVDAYLEHHVRVFGSTHVLPTVKKDMDESQEKLTELENRLARFAGERSISNIDSQRQDVMTNLEEAESKFRVLENLNDKAFESSELGSISGDPAFLELTSRLTSAELKRIELSSRYGGGDRKLIAANQEISELKTLIRKRIISSLSTWKELAEVYRKRLADLDDVKITIDRLRRAVNDQSQSFALAQEKYHESLISNSMDQANISSIKVVEYAGLPSDPVFPKKILILFVSLFFGVVGGIGFAFSYDKVSGRVMSVSDIEELTDVPVLASIPEYRGSIRRNSEKLASHLAAELIPLAELLTREPVPEPRTIMVVSPSHRSGTTLLCENISRLLARETASPAILVSFRFHAKRNRNVEGGRGLEDAIASLLPPASNAESEKAAPAIDHAVIEVRMEDIELFDCRKNLLLESLKKRYATILLDMPSSRSLSLYLKFAPSVDYIFVVAAYNVTNKHPLQRTIDLVRRNNGRITGCILNRRRDVIPDFIYNRIF